ncbi:TPA: hypothetical protein ACGF19_003728 [Vibrio cholerae]
MSTYKYNPYYYYNGPTHTDPWREELSEDESNSRIEEFFNRIESYFNGFEVTINRLSNNVVEIKGNFSEKTCDDNVKECLNKLDLFAHKVK